MELKRSPQRTEKAIVAVLAGAPLHETAARAVMEPADLADAVELYQTAGYSALEAQSRNQDCHQTNIEFADWDTAEHTAVTRLRPELRQAETEGIISSWWFIRKIPCWRLRCRPGSSVPLADAKTFVIRILDAMLSHGLIARSQEAIYEPETYVFGGPEAMDVAHDLFHADSRNILDYLRQHISAETPCGRIGRRELSVLLCGVLMRGAGQDWYEQGDIWNLVTKLRPLPPGTPLDRLPDTSAALRRLMTVDTTNLASDHGTLAFTSDWLNAFDRAGKALADTAQDGKLSRGMRDILAHHVIFHWNRMGLSARTQSILANAAMEVVFEECAPTTFRCDASVAWPEP